MTVRADPPLAAPPVADVAPQAGRPRRHDQGPQILPFMEHFVTLVRQVRRPALTQALVERIVGGPLPALAPLAVAKGTLDIDARRAVFQTVASVDARPQQRLEQAAERVSCLNDHYGAQAVQSLLSEQDAGDAAVLSAPTDRFSRALHLYLRQELPAPGVTAEQRFERAERLQVMGRKWRSQAFASHYRGPKGVVPRPLPAIEAALRERIIGLFPQVAPDDVLIEQFTRRDLLHPRRPREDGSALAPAILHTLTVTFNGTTVAYPQVAAGEVVEHEDAAATTVSFSWEPATGGLAVFSEDRDLRRVWAALFRDLVLGCAGALQTVPMQEYNLTGFASPAMLKRLEQNLVPGVKNVTTLQIKVTRPAAHRAAIEANDHALIQGLNNFLLIGMDRREVRDLYTVAREDHRIVDLSDYLIAQVKLVFRLASQPHRKAHPVSVQITAPNGLTDTRITDSDRRLILDQLAVVGVVNEF